MFTKKFFCGAFALLLIALSFGLIAPHANAAPDAVTVVKSYYDAYNAGNIEQAIEYVADNIIFVNPTGTFVGKAKARENLEAIKKDGLAFDLSNFRDANGHVTYAYKVIIGGQTVETGDGGLTIVRDGRIVFDGTTDTEKEWAPNVVKAYYDAYNAGTIDLAMSYVADDAVFINPTGTYIGKAKARENLEAIKKEGLSFDLFDLKNDNGRVTYSYKVIIGGEAVETGNGGLTVVKNGLVVFDGTVETEKELPTTQAANRLPTTGAAFSTNALWFMALSGLLLAALGATLLKRKSA